MSTITTVTGSDHTPAPIEFTLEPAQAHRIRMARLHRLSQLDDLAHHYPEIDRVITELLQDIVGQLHARS